MPRHHAMHAQRGIALFIGMVFLLILSIVAVMAMRGTLVEMRLGSNTARHEEAFEASEALRSVPLSLFDQHVFERGWPSAMGGTVNDSEFTFSTQMAPTLYSKLATALQKDCEGKVSLFYGPLQGACAGGTLPKETLYDATTWHPDVVLAVCDSSSSTCSANMTAQIAVVPDGSVLKSGAGGAQAAGYRGLGIGSAGGGAALYFEIRSVAQVPGNGVAITHTQYEQTIRN
ncbi:pilus assembly PilX N-terminal domain-containing protein [Luteibacter aegosomaticola]|uniref:pilus assembly PilX family protein n=1 Tax=Luteibacter aegosomaticola TaxID=2911538 RepID=UPI001FFBFD19|nr:pilus assembly PilX N-terminal domain-containing protein [Luteibacter aegosomaticola]UPG88887.1 pilus assembly PilX N-terminal domain-containing protein [Luteibacter aegosomaticola]